MQVLILPNIQIFTEVILGQLGRQYTDFRDVELGYPNKDSEKKNKACEIKYYLIAFWNPSKVQNFLSALPKIK